MVLDLVKHDPFVKEYPQFMYLMAFQYHIFYSSDYKILNLENYSYLKNFEFSINFMDFQLKGEVSHDDYSLEFK